MNWDYLQPVKIHFGKGRVKEIKEIARELGCERGLLVAGPFFFKSGLAEKVIKESEGMIVASFGDVSPNPDVAEVDACAEVIRRILHCLQSNGRAHTILIQSRIGIPDGMQKTSLLTTW